MTMSKNDGLLRSNTAPPAERSSSGGDDVHGRISLAVTPSFGRVYDHEDDQTQPAKKSVLARVRDKARKWRQTFLKKKHAQDGANPTPSWGVTLDEDDDDDEFQVYESELGNYEYKDTQTRNPFSPPSAATNRHGYKDKRTPSNSSAAAVTISAKLPYNSAGTRNPSLMPGVSIDKQEFRDPNIWNSSSPPDQVPTEKFNEDKETPVNDAFPTAWSAAEENENITPSVATLPGLVAEKPGRRKPFSLPAISIDKHRFEDAPVRNPSPFPAVGLKENEKKEMGIRCPYPTPVALTEGHQYKNKPFRNPSLLSASAIEEEDYECEGVLIRKPYPTPAVSTENDEDVKIANPSIPPSPFPATLSSEESRMTKDVPVEKAVVKSNTSSKTLTEMVAETLQPVYDMVSEATQNVAMKFQGERAETRKEASERPRLEKSVSVKEYLMQKLEPGAEERALSRVISDVISPQKPAGVKGEIGMMGKMKEAVTSFLGIEENSSSSAPASSTTASRMVETQEIRPSEEAPGRRMQTEEPMERRLQAN